MLVSSYDTIFDLRDATSESTGVSLSVVVPAYNPGPRFQETVSGVCSVLAEISPHYEVIVVNDGSTDASCVLSQNPRVLFVKKPNGGKGSALALGFSLARGDLVGFIDADGDIPPASLTPLFESLIKDQSVSVAVSSKREIGSLAPHQSVARRVFSLGFRALMRLLAPTGVPDSQVGCKVFRNKHLKDCLPRLKQGAFLVDVELLLLLRHTGRFVSKPVVLRDRVSSTVRLKHIVRMFTGLVSLSTLDTRSFSR